MKRVFMLLAVALMVVAAMAVSGVAQADSPSEMCREKAESLTGKNLVGYTFVVGTEDSNTFSPTKGRAEVFCGFDGGDHISHLNEDDIFIGGAGRDEVGVNTGTFYGGAGDDKVGGTYNYGTFNGGEGDDYVQVNRLGGNFNGGLSNDYIERMFSGVFDGGPGWDGIGHYYGGRTLNVVYTKANGN